MNEQKISTVVSLDDVRENDTNIVVETKVKSSLDNNILDMDDNIKQARAEYITSDKTLEVISKEKNIPLESLKKICSTGKWNILKKDPFVKEYLEEVVNEIYNAIDVYDFGKQAVIQCLKMNEYHNPKDLRALLDTFKLCYDETSKLRVLHTMPDNSIVIENEE